MNRKQLPVAAAYFRCLCKWIGRGLLVLGGVLILSSDWHFKSSWAASAEERGYLMPYAPAPMAGFRGAGDERDADLYPAIAYHAGWDVYLVVWLSLMNAASSGDGFDLYGMFLHPTGTPITQPFRISDSNHVARSSQPALFADEDGFLAIWTRRGNPCRLFVQRITDSGSRPDQPLDLGLQVHQHSPHISYNAERARYVVAYVAGDDYLPPKLFNADVADCGDNPNSNSQIRLAEFAMDASGAPHVERSLTVSEARSGAFRPRIVYNKQHEKYLVIWEDRRRGGENPFRFDVYAQRVDANVTLAGTNLALADGIYENSAPSATWTPRPIASASQSGFLAAWFEPEHLGSSMTWKIQTRDVGIDGHTGDALTAAQTTLLAPPVDNAPSGFLAGHFDPITLDYLLVASTHIESLNGYYSSIRMQRVGTDRALLTLGGAVQEEPTMGSPLDPAAEDQFQVALAQRTIHENRGEHMLVYARRAPGQHSLDFDIWAVRLLSSRGEEQIFIPTVRR